MLPITFRGSIYRGTAARGAIIISDIVATTTAYSAAATTAYSAAAITATDIILSRPPAIIKVELIRGVSRCSS